MTFDSLVLGGTIHTHDRSYAGDVAVSNGRIAAVAAPGVLRPADAARVIDASGCDVIPGCIDVHVHLALPFCGTVSCDDFEHGSRAAVNGCVTTVIDFAIPGKGQTLRQAHGAWMEKAAGRSLVDFCWHMAITDERHLAEIPSLIEMGNPTFKEFMIYEGEGWNSDDARMFTTLELMRRHGGMLLVHAESPRVLDELIRREHTPARMRELGAKLHAITRPHVVEVEAIERAIRWCEETGGRLYVVHMSTGEGADLVKAAQARGVNVLAETCAQYLVLDESVFDHKDGHLFACCPQVKTKADSERLWKGLTREVCVVSTDTCSFTREQKAMWRVDHPEGAYGDWTKIPMGLPGLDTLVPIMHTRGVRAGRIGMNQLVDLCAATPARVMGLWGRKGAIEPGFDADIAVIDPRETRRVAPTGPGKNLQSRCDWSPYEGWELSGFAKHTLVRGVPMLEHGKIVGDLGHGQFLPRRRFPASS